MEELIISVSGLRGIVGRILDCTVAMKFATAFATKLEPGPVVVTRDGRTTGTMLANAICAALNGVGRNVLFGDVAATPTTGILVRQHGAAGGIQISASHNPPEYNGIKLFGSDGRVISASLGEVVKTAFFTNHIDWVEHFDVGQREDLRDTITNHLAKVLSTINVQAIRDREFKVLLNSNHGAGSVLAKALFDELNVTANLIGGTPDGLFENLPEPTEANLRDFAELAKCGDYHVAFAQDPDADRLAVIDERGRYVGEEMTLAIVLKHALERRRGPVVINCATSRMSMDIARSFQVDCHLSPVGEANVCDKMLEVDAVYGGEGNGGPIDPYVGYVRDSFVGIAQILDRMAATNKKISQLIEELPSYAIYKTTCEVPRERISEALDRIEQKFDDAVPSRMDGLRLDWEGHWVLIRASNTEPIVRIIAEANTRDQAEKLADEVQSVVLGLTCSRSHH
ncbi:MAG TPA: phosphoglucosamine mutase [Pirellulaceae bacterium]|nr:phosphoglucosamine mutase [Pirellulaceae bacterium]HMO90657.1 phosphoglucosamine mutase [Pirellulaceae bacterium]HMP67764.1 phosphoglucosamine mutase [Pirellulaceae bacterium]